MELDISEKFLKNLSAVCLHLIDKFFSDNTNDNIKKKSNDFS